MTKRIFVIILLSASTSCRLKQNAPLVYHEPPPATFRCELVPTEDTLRFGLTEETFDANSWNVREVNGHTVIAFFDRFSLNISEYSYPALKLINRISLSPFFKSGLIKSAHLQDYDHIFLTTAEKLIIIDSTGKIRQQFNFGSSDKRQRAVISADNPLTIDGNNVYISLDLGANRRSKSSMRRWEVMWSADLKNNTTDRQYYMPETYRENIYPSKFTQYAYCVNDSGRFVISFSADSLLYETDLSGYNHAWLAKTSLQIKPAPTIPEEKKISVSEEKVMFLRNTHYSAVFYDKVHQRYLRLTKAPLSDEEIKNADFKHANRVVILDKNFRVIGESDLPLKIHFQKSLFTPDGKIYSRVSSGQEDILAFVRLEYREPQKLTTK